MPDPGTTRQQHLQTWTPRVMGWGCLSLCSRVLHVVCGEPQGPEGQLPWLLRSPEVGVSGQATVHPGARQPLLVCRCPGAEQGLAVCKRVSAVLQSLHCSCALGVTMGLLFKSPDAKRKRKLGEQREMAVAKGYKALLRLQRSWSPGAQDSCALRCLCCVHGETEARGGWWEAEVTGDTARADPHGKEHKQNASFSVSQSSSS